MPILDFALRDPRRPSCFTGLGWVVTLQEQCIIDTQNAFRRRRQEPRPLRRHNEKSKNRDSASTHASKLIKRLVYPRPTGNPSPHFSLANGTFPPAGNSRPSSAANPPRTFDAPQIGLEREHPTMMTTHFVSQPASAAAVEGRRYCADAQRHTPSLSVQAISRSTHWDGIP